LDRDVDDDLAFPRRLLLLLFFAAPDSLDLLPDGLFWLTFVAEVVVDAVRLEPLLLDPVRLEPLLVVLLDHFI
jgi:hypothetical protein